MKSLSTPSMACVDWDWLRPFAWFVPMIVLSMAAASAAIYHISPGQGNDGADGLTEATALNSAGGLKGRTLGGDDRVLFRAGGVHRGTVEIKARGAAGKPVVIGRYGEGPAPVIDGAGASAALVLPNPDHLVVQEIEVTNRGESGTARNGIEIRANDGSVAEDITLQNLHIHHVSGHDDRNGGCGILAGAGKSPQGQASRYDGLRIENCLLHDLPFNGILVSGWETRGRNARGDLADSSTRIVIRGNLLHDIAGDGICVITTSGTIIEHNEVYRSCLGQVRGHPEAASAGIWPHTSDGTIMRFNRVEGIRGKKDGQAFDVDYDCRNTLVENNFTRDNGTGFLLVCAGMEKGKDLGTRGVMVRNNLCVDECAEPPGALITLVSRVRGITFENNAFVFSQSGERRLLYAGNWLGPDWPQDIQFRRNLLITAGTLRIESGQAEKVDFRDNLWSGGFPFDRGNDRGLTASMGLLGRLSESFATALAREPGVAKIGLKPFDPTKAGLPADSRMLELARKAGRGASGSP